MADGAAGQRVGEREPGGVAGLQPGVAGLQLQPRRRLPVRRRRQPEPPREQHQCRRQHHDLVGGRADVVAPDALRPLPAAGPHRRQRRHGPERGVAVEPRHGGGHGRGGGELGGHGDTCCLSSACCCSVHRTERVGIFRGRGGLWTLRVLKLWTWERWDGSHKGGLWPAAATRG